MCKLTWLHVQFNIIILMVFALTAYITVLLSRVDSDPKFFVFYQITSKLSAANKSITKGIVLEKCVHCNTSINSSNSSDLSTLEYERFSQIPFRTVEDAWSPQNSVLSKYVRAEEQTAIFVPNFQVYGI